MKNKDSCCLSGLLPYEAKQKRNACLQKGLKEYQSLLRAFLESLHCWNSREFEKFDGLVGENACEIRATCLSMLALSDELRVPFLMNQILLALDKIENLLSAGSINRLMMGDTSLKTLLEREDLDIVLTNEEMFVLQAYLLCTMRVVKNEGRSMNSIYIIEASDPKRYCQFGDISISFAGKLTSKLRRALATASVQFVRSCACRLQDQSLMKMVSDQFTVLENTLPCTPMFWTYKILLLAAQEQGIPLVIHVKFVEKEPYGYTIVDEDCIVFQGDENTPFTEVNLDQIDPDQAACVIQGIAVRENGQGLTKAQWRALMRETPMMDVILAGAADHRQFPDPTQDALIEALNDKEYKNYKAMAKQRGFSDENPATFFIQHVYAACAGKIISEVLGKSFEPFPLERDAGNKTKVFFLFMPQSRLFFPHGFSKMSALQPMSR